MTALADHLTAQQDRGSHGGPGAAGTGPVTVPGPADRSGTVRDQPRTIRSWPLLLLAFPAAEVWSGWVGIVQKTGFSLVHPLPGIWSSLHLDTTITLPIGVEMRPAPMTSSPRCCPSESKAPTTPTPGTTSPTGRKRRRTDQCYFTGMVADSSGAYSLAGYNSL